jgi:hypothetical protein
LSAVMAPVLMWLLISILSTITAIIQGHAPVLDLHMPLRVVAVLSLANATFALFWKRRVGQIISRGLRRPAELALVAHMSSHIEKADLRADLLLRLQRSLRAPTSASRAITHLTRLAELYDSRLNPAVRMLGPFLLWTTQTAFAIERWHIRYGLAAK